MKAAVQRTDPTSPEPGPRRVQFGIRSLLLIMLLVSVLAAIGAGLISRGSGRPKGPLVIMAVAAPMGAMIVLSLVESVIRGIARLQARRRPKRTDSDDDGIS